MSKRRSVLLHGFSRALAIAILGLGLSYLFVVVVVMAPLTQTYITFAHNIHFSNNLGHPEDHGLAPGKTVNMKLQSSDNTTLGAWFIFADSIHRSTPLVSPSRDHLHSNIPSAIETRPTILFLHGNTGTRALPLRITVYTGLTARLDANVFTVDYRGFGDSDGYPTIPGVAQDARAAWNYLMLQGARPQDVLIVGHSLGAAIAGLLAADLSRDGIEPRGLVLMSAFSSLRELMVEYYLFGFLPLLKPFTTIPLAPHVLTWALQHPFDTLTLVPDVKTSVLLAHAADDWDIPHTHSSSLYDAFLHPYLLPAADLMMESPTPNQSWSERTAQNLGELKKQHNALIKTTTIPRFGTLKEFIDQGKSGRRVAMLKTNAGGHDLGRLEGVQDVIGRMFGFY